MEPKTNYSWNRYIHHIERNGIETKLMGTKTRIIRKMNRMYKEKYRFKVQAKKLNSHDCKEISRLQGQHETEHSGSTKLGCMHLVYLHIKVLIFIILWDR